MIKMLPINHILNNQKLNRDCGVTMNNQLLNCVLIISLGLSVASKLAFAESADRDKPIELEADSLSVNDAKKTSTYTGNVILTQGTLIIRAAKLIVREDKDGFQHSTSTGNPTTFKQKREGKNEYMEGSAQRIEYDGRMDKVQLYTKAWVKRNEDIVHGDYISYDAIAEYAEVIGGVKSESGGTTSGRVKATIQPKNKPGQTAPKPEEISKEPAKESKKEPTKEKNAGLNSTDLKSAGLKSAGLNESRLGNATTNEKDTEKDTEMTKKLKISNKLDMQANE
jgi:lipopolysaccharide export system protein LptA